MNRSISSSSGRTHGMFRVVLMSAFTAIVLSAGAVAAQVQMSGGVSAHFGSNFGSGVEAKIVEQGISVSTETKTPWFGGGIGGFFDLGYVEISLDYVYGSGNAEITASAMGFSYSEKMDMSYSFLDISLLGKYPINIGNMTVFPTAGITYQLCVSAELDGMSADDANDLSRLWFKFGGGADYPLNDKMYLRTTVLYGIGLDSTFEDDLKKELGGGDILMSHGLTIKAGIGFNF